MRILRIKQRSVKQGLILVAGSIDQFAPFLEGLNQDQLQRLQLSWPGPVTFLVPDRGVSPDFIRGDHVTVALRVSAHPVVQSLCQMLGDQWFRPRRIDRASRQPYLSQRLPSSLPVKSTLLSLARLGGQAGPSEIIDLVTGQVLRPQGAR